jgi:CelD/BcsL family acetyltransferase involved in cellulose biosynthesis
MKITHRQFYKSKVYMPTATQQPYSVTVESFETLFTYWRNSDLSLKWDCFFVLPPWLKAWWCTFGSNSEMYLCAVRHEQEVIGIAPLLMKNATVSFMGSTDVCDFQDFIITPERSNDFFNVLLDDLNDKGITALDLKSVHPDSATMRGLVDIATKRGCEVIYNQSDVSFELDLPTTWDEYLLQLKGKQRHEIRRKLRRLKETGNISYRVVKEVKEVKKEIETFFKLFRLSRKDKETFMTDKMTSFFRSLAESLAAEKMLKLFFMDINEIPAAAVLCFDDKSRVYLYNNGFDIRFNPLSVGTLCKLFSIKDSIENSKHKYDFLKGAESYKYRLGGKEVPLYECKINLQ